MEVLFKRTAEDGLVAVGGEGAGEDRDVSKSGFEWFVKDV